VGADRLAELFDAHHLRLYRLARRLSGHADSARDLVQQTFLHAARHPGSLPAGEPGGEAWLVRTLVNLCHDRRRRLHVRQRAAGRLAVADRTASTESATIARASVQAALATLPPRQRAVVALHYLEDRDTADIAILLGITRVTVRWHLAAARRRLQQLLLPRTSA
jgi:RNA polymerase sigma-70 factor (ECF subfamily)